jgi:hypothetical protein
VPKLTDTWSNAFPGIAAVRNDGSILRTAAHPKLVEHHLTVLIRAGLDAELHPRQSGLVRT